MGGRRYCELLAGASANIASIAMGTALAWPSPVFLKLTDPNLEDNPVGRVLSEGDQSWIDSVLTLGGFFGPFVAGFIAERKGRRVTLLFSSVIYIISWTMLMVVRSVPLLILGRFLSGLAGGYVLVAVTMYVGEIASDEYRGAHGSLMQIGTTIGILYVYCIGPFVSYLALQGFCCAIPVLFAVLFVYMPETPHYHVSVGQHGEATKSLMFLRGATHRDEVQEEQAKIKQYIEQQRQESLNRSQLIRSLFTNRANLRALLISLGLIAFQQWTGIDCIISYSESIFAKAGMFLRPAYCSIIVGVVQVVCSTITPFFIDRYGRRPILLGSSLGLCISLAVLGTFFLLDNLNVPMTTIDWIPLASLIAFVALYNCGFGPVPWAITAEIFAHDVKPIGSAINVSASLLLDFLAIRLFLLIGETVGYHWAFWVFSIACLAAFVFTLLMVFETRGLSLQEVQNRLLHKRTTQL